MRTAKAQSSLRIRAVWSGPLLSAYRIIAQEEQFSDSGASWKHAYVICTHLNPLLYSKTGVYRVYIIFHYFR